MSTYVIGDVHGCYDDLMVLFSKINMHREDTYYFVGDWIDRAPSDEMQMQLIKWFNTYISRDGMFRSVMGNHDYFNVTKNIAGCLEGLMDRYESDIRTFVDKVRSLPLCYVEDIKCQKNLITHSWVVDSSGNELPLHKLYKADIYKSVWERKHSISSYPVDFRVIHGHTNVVHHSVIDLKHPSIINRVRYFNEHNIDIDCGCYLGIQSGGNLAAYRLEDNKIFYAYDEDDVRIRCEDIEEVSNGKVKAFEVLPIFSQYRNGVLDINIEWVKEYKRLFFDKYGLDGISDKEFYHKVDVLNKLSINEEKLKVWR